MNDFLSLLGMGLLAFGLTTRFGADVACIIIGGLFMLIAILGAMRK